MMTVLRNDVATELKNLNGTGQVLCADPNMKTIEYLDYQIAEENVIDSGKTATEIIMENGVKLILVEGDCAYGELGLPIPVRKIKRHTAILAYKVGILKPLKVKESKPIAIVSRVKVAAALPVLINGVPIQCAW